MVDLETPKSPFEINWPLVENKNRNKSNQIFGFPHSEFDFIMTKSADDMTKTLEKLHSIFWFFRCAKRGQKYYWCHKESTLWGYCTPERLIEQLNQNEETRELLLLSFGWFFQKKIPTFSAKVTTSLGQAIKVTIS